MYKGNQQLQYEKEIETIAGYIGLVILVIAIVITSQGAIIL
jgi:hypothetical protein